jgi:hypothetical protein
VKVLFHRRCYVCKFLRDLGLIPFLLLGSEVWADWYTTTVDTTPYSGAYGTSIALDSMDYPHIAYCRYKTDGLMYASWDGEEWQLEKVFQSANAKISGLAGAKPFLALDSRDRPHISFWWGCLGYAWKDSAGWHYTKADSTVWMEHASLALDSNDLPHVAYIYQIRGWPHELFGASYAYYDGVSWHNEMVDTAYHMRSISIAIDGNNHPCIAYDFAYEYGGGIKYAELDSAGWRFETLGEGDYWYGAVSLAIDSADKPHIVWSGYYPAHGGYILYYATREDNGWHAEIANVGGGSYTSLHLDLNDNPHISYVLHFWLRYAGWDGMNWHNEQVDSIRNTSPGNVSYTSIVADKDGYVHISYWREFVTDEGVLRYATGLGVTGVSGKLERKSSKTTLEVFPTVAMNELKIAYSLDKGGDVSVSVYNILGQRIATLVSEKKDAGKHVSYWSLKDDKGKIVRNGIYFCSLKTGDSSLNKKFIVIK